MFHSPDLSKGENSGFLLRRDRLAVTERRLETSAGLVIVLLISTFVAAAAVPFTGTKTGVVANPTSFASPVKSNKAAPFRVIPIFGPQATNQAQAKRLSALSQE
jgi:hypothetical protein